ncbi:uncharacterized protein RSE6_07061 [Rhynchosporium secalis]|uniref:Uncharacterized protein n=1 Tax=Rhynchosporium secalis TaxID=38038 RepID=A0A1E1MBY9_RHYSE|nr:uncharacterized protein RSE6_07061 [Rhynchosporium secalis]
MHLLDLIHPPRWTRDIGDRYRFKAGHEQEGYINSAMSCLNKPSLLNVTRAPFPFSGCSLVLEFVSDTASPNPYPIEEKFWLVLYLADDKAVYSDDHCSNTVVGECSSGKHFRLDGHVLSALM